MMTQREKAQLFGEINQAFEEDRARLSDIEDKLDAILARLEALEGAKSRPTPRKKAPAEKKAA